MSAPAAPTAAPPLAIVLLSVAAFAAAANMRVIDPLLVQLSASFGVTVGQASIAATAERTDSSDVTSNTDADATPPAATRRCSRCGC